MAHGHCIPALLLFLAATTLAEAVDDAQAEEVVPPVAKEHAAPVLGREVAHPGAREGTVWLSNRQSVAGKLYLTREKALRVWDAPQKRHRDIRLAELSLIEVIVVTTLAINWPP